MSDDNGLTRSLNPPPEHDSRGEMGHALSAMDAGVLAEVFADWRDENLQTAARIVRADNVRETRKLRPGNPEKLGEALGRAQSWNALATEMRSLRDEHTSKVAFRSEPRVYGPGSPNSYYLDVARAAVPGNRYHDEAVSRLRRYSDELAVEARAGSPEGRRALQIADTRSRELDKPPTEERAGMTSGTTSGGSFVTPQHLVELYGLYHAYPPSFYLQTQKLNDVGYGLEVYLPAFDSTATTGQQVSENSGVTSSNPTAGLISASLLTFAGEIDVSQQLLDRAGPVDFDSVAHAAMTDSLAQQIDSYVITQATASAGTVSGASSFTANGLYGDLAEAKSQMLTAAGTRLPATHVFFQPEFGEWVLAQGDPDGRPLLLPTPAGLDLPLIPAPNGGPPPGYQGTRLLSTPVFEDGSIPPSGSNTQILVANMGEVFTLKTESVVRAIPETFATSLTVALQLYCLVGVIVRHTAAVQVVSGNAYSANPSWA